MTPATPALELADLRTWHGEQPALQGICLRVALGQVVVLQCGDDFQRSALLSAILGLADKRTGSMRINGTEAIHLPFELIHGLGLGYTHPSPDVLPSLSCEENLLMPSEHSISLGGGLSLTEIFDIFPGLEHYRHLPSAHLSVADRHLLALARLLRTGVSLLVLNRISESLGPTGLSALSRAVIALKEHRYTLILLERCHALAADIADCCYIMENGSLNNRQTIKNAKP